MGEHRVESNKFLLQLDAKNRAVRSFIQNFAMDLVAALAVWVVPLFTDAENWSDFSMSLMGLMFLKTLIVTFFSFVMRNYLDGSRVPTPLPPAPVARPADPA